MHKLNTASRVENKGKKREGCRGRTNPESLMGSQAAQRSQALQAPEGAPTRKRGRPVSFVIIGCGGRSRNGAWRTERPLLPPWCWRDGVDQ